jgi:hypothetical protein
MSPFLRLTIMALAVLIALNICASTGLIGGSGKWYSPSTPYRRQTEALLAGRVALSPTPTEIEHDMAWGRNGVQQVWGLGVPVWRMPFEGVARIFGQPGFPDRLELLAAIATATYVVLCVFTVPPGLRCPSIWLNQLIADPGRLIVALLLVAFPPIMTMCSGPFNVYEEAVVYQYYFCVGLFAATFAILRNPTLRSYILVSILAGLSGFIRPTALPYGAATTLIVCYRTYKIGWTWKKSLIGPALFICGGCLLYLSNLQRFGSGFEFGHSLNLSSLDLMYALRFVAPYSSTSVWLSIRELFGSLFFVKELNGFDCYRENIVAWQADVPRWRHFYGTTFDASYLMAVVFCWLATVCCWTKRCCRDGSRPVIELSFFTMWPIIAGIPLIAFYVHYNCLSSRYILDFAPALNAGIVGAFFILESGWSRSWLLKQIPRATLFIAVIAWWAYEVASGHNFFPPTEIVSQSEVMESMAREVAEPNTFPNYYSVDSNPVEITGIRSNGYGWQRPSGETNSMVVLFVNDPKTLVLDLAPNFNVIRKGENINYRLIQAKIGLETLHLDAEQKTPSGERLIFSAPEREAYRKGIQIVFLSLTRPDNFLDPTSPFRLLQVRWTDAVLEK